MPNDTRKQLTRAAALAQLRDVIVKHAPSAQAALEIFDAANDLAIATIEEMRVGIVDTLNGTVTS